jgi:hypothetical protein
MKICTLEDLINAWKKGERGHNLYKNSASESISLHSNGIHINSGGINSRIVMSDYNLSDTYTKVENIVEANLIGAMKIHKEGKATKFRLKGDSTWFNDPLTLAYNRLFNPIAYQFIIECKMEDEL